MLVGTRGGRKRGRQRMRWLDGITDSMDMSVWRNVHGKPTYDAPLTACYLVQRCVSSKNMNIQTLVASCYAITKYLVKLSLLVFS